MALETTSPDRRPAASAPRTARERVRRELTAEIKAVALAHLSLHGGAALSLRAVARELGMASSALFRYFPNRDALLTALIIDSYTALADAAEAADVAVHERSIEDRWMAICHAVRNWALAHPEEYALIFGSPIPGYAAPQDTVAPATRVPMLLGQLLAGLTVRDGSLADARELPAGRAVPAGSELSAGREVPPDGELPADVVRALAPLSTTIPPQVPRDLVVRGLMGWTYLFGAVSFEVFGHRHEVVSDHAAFFDHEIRRLAVLLGFTDRG